MTNRLIKDYLKRAEIRIKSLEFYREHQDYPDVVREAQEVVELLLKAILRHVGIEAPKIHDVSKVIEKHLQYMPLPIQKNIKEIKKISKGLRKEREICFYGADDFIPTEEYTQEDASVAIENAKFIFNLVKEAIEMK